MNATSEKTERIAPLVAAYLATKQEPCTILELEDVLRQLEIDTFDVRNAVWYLVHENQALFTPSRLVQATPTTEVPDVVRLALGAILQKHSCASLVAAGEALLLCKKYYPVTEIIELLETIGDNPAANKLRESMVRAGAINPEEVQPY